jgi:hypothetical protein
MVLLSVLVLVLLLSAACTDVRACAAVHSLVLMLLLPHAGTGTMVWRTSVTRIRTGGNARGEQQQRQQQQHAVH